MKKRILGLALTLGTTGAFATNGDNMIGIGPVTRAMGGTGTAYSVGAESALKNPALLRTNKDLEVDFAATMFMPKVTANNSGASGDDVESASDQFAIPAIGLIYKISEKMNFGVGAYGVSGLGVDYRDSAVADGVYRMSTALSLFKFAPSVSYNINKNLSIGGGIHLLHGTLAIAYDAGGGFAGQGVSQSLGTGFDFGAAYEMGNMTFGFNYQSQIAMEYKYQLEDSATPLGVTDVDSDKLDQPTEMTFGFAYNAGKWMATLDYKMIQWSSAAGYEEFGWDDQAVIALGGAYMHGKNTYRLGYSTANSPLGEDAIETATNKDALNLLGFPANITTHYSFGFSRQVSERFGFDIAYVMAPEAKDDINGGVIEVKHSQSSLSAGGRWSF
jgi:long-chain fatty acid transport protein